MGFVMCGGGAAIGSFGVCKLALLEKLPVIFVSTPPGGNKSRWTPSKICMSVLREPVAVLDCRRNCIVLPKSV